MVKTLLWTAAFCHPGCRGWNPLIGNRRAAVESLKELPAGPRGAAQCSPLLMPRRTSVLHSSPHRNNEVDTDEEDEEEFIRQELLHLEALEEILAEFDGDLDDDDDEDEMMWDADSLSELLGSIGDDDEEEEDDFVDEDDEATYDDVRSGLTQVDAARGLERALLQGVVPVSAGVGTDCLPGDFGFDPLNLATKDYFYQTQSYLLNLLPSDDEDRPPRLEKRPRALILRDYREAEIRHSRLAMLAALFWPLQEMLDRLLLDPDQYGPLIYGPVTLPYFPLIMTAIMLLLGYLDIYSQAIKDMDKIGEAYLPGDCFWDPLRILQGTPDATKRRMQERELFNGRAAMLAILVFTWEEAISHKPLIDIEGNDVLFEPAYQIPFVQHWLDDQFSSTDPEVTFYTPTDLGRVLEDTVDSMLP